MDDIYESFEDDVKEYVDIVLTGAKLTQKELEEKFGEARYQEILKHGPMNRYIADKKLEKAKKKESAKNVKLDLLLDYEARMRGLKAMFNILDEGTGHKDYYNAGRALLQGDLNYMANKGKVLAESESDLPDVQVFQLAYPRDKNKDD